MIHKRLKQTEVGKLRSLREFELLEADREYKHECRMAFSTLTQKREVINAKYRALINKEINNDSMVRG